MKRHAIIPVFIPHRGCPNDCVFCNQKKITGGSGELSLKEIREKIELWLKTLRGRPGIKTVEIAFYGGSFTGIPQSEQTAFLSVAKEYKEKGLVQRLRLSTRPDYIDEAVLDNLKRMSVDVIELGVQSFDEEVLRASRRGHDVSCVEKSAELIRDYGFTLGIQLMIGLPKDSLESCIASAKRAIDLKAELARLYPVVIIRDTQLYEMWKGGTYVPPSQQEIVKRTARMYQILTDGGVQVIRVGLKSSDLIREGAEAEGGTFHPAVRQLVCGLLARETLEQQLKPILNQGGRRISFYANGNSMSEMIGWRKENKTYFQNKYPHISLRFERDDSLADGQYRCRIKEP